MTPPEGWTAADAAGAGAGRAGMIAAIGALAGMVLSGPLAVAAVNAVQPQPAWRGAEQYARSYHPIQLLPYLGGILLVGALIVLIATLHASARREQKSATAAALVFCAAFASFIFFNYTLQTTFLPALAQSYAPESAGVVAAFSMSNPTSLAWGIEMWGWAFFGVAGWLAAPVFRKSRLERVTAATFVANGVVSVTGALVTVARPGWVMTSAGLAAFAIWNGLLTVMALLAATTFYRRWRAPGGVRASIRKRAA